MKHLYIYLSLFFFLSLVACGKNKSSEPAVPVLPQKTEMERFYPDFEESIISDSLKHTLSDVTHIGLFYKKNQYPVIWVKDIYNDSRLDTLLSCISQSADHGLSPELFDWTEIESLRDSLKNNSYKDKSSIYQSFSRLEYLCSKAYIDYVTGMRYGFTNPKELFPDDYFINVALPDSVYYADLYVSLKEKPIDFLQASHPSGEYYLKLQSLLKEYIAISDSSFIEVPFKKGKKSLVLNQSDTILPHIARRLMITGELPRTEYADSLYSTLNEDLLAAINLFRVHNSYPEANELGEGTVNSLNRPFSYYYKTAQANLERARWQTASHEKSIRVNVAAFILQAIEPGQEPVKMNVCVGIAVTNQTPLLESEISYMNLNPKWNVPESIIEKEIYWHVLKDSSYLRKNQMKVLTKKGEEVDPSTIDWKSLNAKRVPYLIRQESGNANSLGRIKFMFNNPFSVYLHDTPSKSRFLARNRSVSHGCVRVQNPMDLAFFCLAEKDSLYFDRIRHSIDLRPLSEAGQKALKQGNLKKVNDIVSLNKKVPVIIDYATIYLLASDKKLYFADDVYFFDSKILEALFCCQ